MVWGDERNSAKLAILSAKEKGRVLGGEKEGDAKYSLFVSVGVNGLLRLFKRQLVSVYYSTLYCTSTLESLLCGSFLTPLLFNVAYLSWLPS